jgi:uncharacterized HAD superfamily protein
MRIGIDFDEVIADSLEALVTIHNNRHGTAFKKEDVTSYSLRESYGGKKEEWDATFAAFLSTDHLSQLNPMADVISAMDTLKKHGHELYIVTARTDHGLAAAELWLKTHLPKTFNGIHHTEPLATNPEVKKKKAEICKENGIELMIDDHRGVAEECAEAGIRVFLFNYPWNQGDLPKNIERVFSWDDILRKIDS